MRPVGGGDMDKIDGRAKVAQESIVAYGPLVFLKTLYADSELLCSSTLNLIMEGKSPVESSPVVHFPASHELHSFESLALTITTEFTVAFIGSSTGHIQKVFLESSTKGELYDSAITVDEGRAISQDMVFDDSQMYLYAMSDRKVAKIPVQNCSRYITCGDCLSSRDPYCGWCTLSHRCSLKSECDIPTATHWVNGPNPNDNCIAILNVSPLMAHVSQVITLYLTVHRNLPRDDNTTYNCVFSFPSGDQKISPADLKSNGIECQNPNVNDLSLTFSTTLGHINISLGIQCVQTGQVIVSAPYLLYKCSSFASCSRCVDNVYWCDWCITENKCQYNTEQCSGEKVSSRSGNEGNRGRQFCPMVEKIQTGPLFIPQDQSKTIIIQGRNFPEPDEYKGKIYLPSSQTLNVPGIRISATLLAFNIEKESIINVALPNGRFGTIMIVLWTNQNFVIENDGLEVTLYSCRGQAKGDCSFCKNLEETYLDMKCKWCGGQCVYKQQRCPQSSCPGPNVTSLTPNTGHFLGGTVVTITGFNLGIKFADIENNITIAGIACNTTARRDDYLASKRIRCVTGGRSGGGSGPINILGVTLNKWIYSYKTPMITGFQPKFAAQSGGRIVHLRGGNLNIGNGPKVTINNDTCLVTSKNMSVISCVVPAGSTGVANVSVNIDSNPVDTTTSNFSYVEDPTVQNIYPVHLSSFERIS